MNTAEQWRFLRIHAFFPWSGLRLQLMVSPLSALSAMSVLHASALRSQEAELGHGHNIRDIKTIESGECIPRSKSFRQIFHLHLIRRISQHLAIGALRSYRIEVDFIQRHHISVLPGPQVLSLNTSTALRLTCNNVKHSRLMELEDEEGPLLSPE